MPNVCVSVLTVHCVYIYIFMQVVPESQLSVGHCDKNTAPKLLPAPSASVQVKWFNAT